MVVWAVQMKEEREDATCLFDFDGQGWHLQEQAKAIRDSRYRAGHCLILHTRQSNPVPGIEIQCRAPRGITSGLCGPHSWEIPDPDRSLGCINATLKLSSTSSHLSPVFVHDSGCLLSAYACCMTWSMGGLARLERGGPPPPATLAPRGDSRLTGRVRRVGSTVIAVTIPTPFVPIDHHTRPTREAQTGGPCRILAHRPTRVSRPSYLNPSRLEVV